MGQYYHQVLETKDKNGNKVRKYFNTQIYEWFETGKSNYYNGLKLMEHSWWRNDFCTRLAKKLRNKPSRLAWVGDYADEEECRKFGFDYEDVWGGQDEDYFTVMKETDFTLDKVKYLVNLDKKCYIDLAEYKKKSEDDFWVVFPLSLLTAIGNGRGGGDYSGTCMEYVGAWTFDLIEFTNKIPSGFVKEEVYFKEN